VAILGTGHAPWNSYTVPRFIDARLTIMDWSRRSPTSNPCSPGGEDRSGIRGRHPR
jgi:hypothetical protein